MKTAFYLALVGQADTFSLRVTRLLLPHAVRLKKLFQWEFEIIQAEEKHNDFSCNVSVKNGNY